MAESIRPWLVEHLVDIGEKFGGNLSSVPRYEKKKKVQLVEFLTYGIASQDDCLWAKLSDKFYKIPVRLSRTALAEYARFNNKRLTEHKTALVSIKNFRPFFSRVPLPNGRGMSEKPSLALEIDEISIVGSIGEAPWGDPLDIEANDLLHQWSEGLRKDGGSCNILMEMKKQRDANGQRDPPRDKKRDPLPVAPQKRNGVNPVIKPPDSRITYKSTPDKVDLLKEYERSWRPIIGNLALYASKPKPAKEAAPRSPAEVCVESTSSKQATSNHPPQRSPSETRPPRRTGSDPLDLGSSPPSRDPSPPPAQDQQSTPPLEEWPASQTRDPSLPLNLTNENSQDYERAPTSQAIENVKCEDDEGLPSTFDFGPPTPQRLRPQKQDVFPSPPTSSPARPSPSPSLPPISTSTPNSSPIAQLQTRGQVVRRVPYPVPPPPPNSSSHPRILAPNSDTSQSQSQRSQVPQLSSENPCLTEDRVWEDKEDESHVRSYLFTQPDDYDGDQSVMEQNSEVMNKSFNGLFTLPPGEDFGIAQDTAIDGEDQRDNENHSEANDEDHRGNERYGRASSAHNANSGSVVPDSQGDQLDDDDAQIAESLFGKTQSCMADDSTAAIDPKSVIEASVPDELPSFAGLRQIPARGIESPSNAHDRLDSNNQPRKSVSEHDPDTWRVPAFMRDADVKNKGKQKIGILEPENKSVVVQKAKSATPFVSNGTNRVAAVPVNQSRPQSPASCNNRPVTTMAKVSSSPAPPALGRAQGTTVGVPNIDLRSVSRRSRKRSRLSECSFDLDGSVEGSVKKRRRTGDSVSFETESAPPRSQHHDELELDGSRRGGADMIGDSETVVSTDARRRLKEFVSSTGFGKRKPNDPSSAQYNSDRPPWMSWPTLQGILLQTGRHRDKQAKQMMAKAGVARK